MLSLKPNGFVGGTSPSPSALKIGLPTLRLSKRRPYMTGHMKLHFGYKHFRSKYCVLIFFVHPFIFLIFLSFVVLWRGGQGGDLLFSEFVHHWHRLGCFWRDFMPCWVCWTLQAHSLGPRFPKIHSWDERIQVFKRTQHYGFYRGMKGHQMCCVPIFLLAHLFLSTLPVSYHS